MTKRTLPSFGRGLAALCFCMGLQACATVRQPALADLALLSTTLTEPVEALSDRAAEGQAQAQFAMALLYAYGLRGVALDQPQAALLRRKALAARLHADHNLYRRLARQARACVDHHRPAL
ncbi:MAG: hypothetical protein J7515_12510 [Caulobacter sp.]|nr:hypothetical protein [Caulobacter sp.]